MTREERAELTVRAAGAGFLTATLAGLVPLVNLAELLRPWPGRPPMVLAGVVAALAMAAVGYAFVLRWRRVAWLLRPRDEQEGGEAELLRAGVFLLGVFGAFSVCRAAALTAADESTREFWVPAVLAGLPAVLFLARPRALIAWLAGCARRGSGDGRRGPLVAAGVALIALALLTDSLVSAADMALRPPAPPELAAFPGMAVRAARLNYVAAAAGAAAALLAFAFCGGIGGRLARGVGETPIQVAGRMGRRGWIVFVMFCVVLARALRALFFPGGIVAGQYAVPYGLLQGALVLGFPVLAALVARPVARRLYPEEADSAESRAGVTLALETAITVLALAYILAGLRRASQNDWPVAVLILPVLLLAVRGDVARWCARPTEEPQDAAPTRRAVLQPWLGLLGVYLFLRNLPGLAAAAAAAPGLIPSGRAVSASTGTAPSWPALVLPAVVPALVLPAAGLALLLAARPLARLLSYGPLLRRLTRALWKLGWTRRTDS